MTDQTTDHPPATSEPQTGTDAKKHASSVDLSEKGMKEGRPISLDRRLFMKFTAFGDCSDIEAVSQALADAGVEGALYLDTNDANGIASSRSRRTRSIS